MDKNKIMDAMEAKANEIFNKTEQYQKDGKRGVFTAQVRSVTHSGRWETVVQSFGAANTPPEMQDGKMVFAGVSFEGVVHGKVAYARRTGKNSGAPENETPMAESHWEGAVVSTDGNCICAFSGIAGSDDVLIAEAGIAMYESLLPKA